MWPFFNYDSWNFNWNWTNCWRVTFILILLGIFFDCMELPKLAYGFGIPGGVAFIIMFVVRFEDVQKVMDRR